MANNNNTTTVEAGTLQPRLYQVYGDLIESKEVMEPIAICAGQGPVCGFDWVDTSKPYVTITSIFKASGLSPEVRRLLTGKSKRVIISDKDNSGGMVYNAYTTPDGLLHIAPDSLTFELAQPSGGWPDKFNPQKLIAFTLVARHRYIEDGSENPPSISDFYCEFVQLSDSLTNILSYDYQDIVDLMVNQDLNYGENTDSILGLYLVGWNPAWDGVVDPYYKDLMKLMNYTLCLVPTEGKFPVKPWVSNPFDILRVNQKISTIEKYLSKVLIGNGSIQIQGTGSSLYVFVHYSKMGTLNLSIAVDGDSIGNGDTYGLISNYNDFRFEWYSNASDPTISIKSLFQAISKYYSVTSLLDGNPCRYTRCNMVSPTNGAKLTIHVTASDIKIEVSKIGDSGDGVGNFTGDFTFIIPYPEVSSTIE